MGALYVHVPFCVSICPYCDFVVYAGRAARGPDSQTSRFVDALVTEIALRGRRTAPLRSVYLGGGTPSLLQARQVARILDAVAGAFGIESAAEVTIEVNPGPHERGELGALREAGVTRVSIGAQSFDAAELRRLGRRHNAADVADTFGAARRAGFESISLDLLYDVPGQTLASWAASLAAALELEPDHVSAYALTLDDGTVGADQLPPRSGATTWRARARPEQDEDRAADMYELADETLARAGLSWYEISNWARQGHASRHNVAYWRSELWEAVGPGAHRYDGIRRGWNSARLDGYLSALERGDLPPGESTEDLSEHERVALRLRTADGIAADDVSGSALEQLEWAQANGLASIRSGRIVLTRAGRLLANEVMRGLSGDEERRAVTAARA